MVWATTRWRGLRTLRKGMPSTGARMSESDSKKSHPVWVEDDVFQVLKEYKDLAGVTYGQVIRAAVARGGLERDLAALGPTQDKVIARALLRGDYLTATDGV
jgi:hypothetical protein